MKTMINNMRILGVLLICLMTFSGNAWGTTTLIFDFTSNPGSWPTSASAGNYTYTLNGTTYTFALGNDVYMNSYNSESYLMLKNTTTLGLPAISGKKLVHVDICNSSQCSTGTYVAVTSNTTGTAVTGGANKNFSTQSYVYRYSLSETSANTMYYLYIITKNCQITRIALTYENTDTYKVTYNAERGSCNEDDATEVSANAGVTLPTATPDAAGWEFAGWADEACSETTTAPRLYYAGDVYYPEQATTLHAVYRKIIDGTSTSTATFDASTLSGLTNISEDPYIDYWWKHTTSGVEFWINEYGIYNGAFNLDDAERNGYAMIYANRRIKEVVFTASSASYLIDDVLAYDAGEASLSTSDTEQTVTCSGNVTQIYIVAPSKGESYITEFTVTYYDTKFSSNPCSNIVTLSKGTEKNCSIALSAAAVETCGGASTRQVTVTVTPNAGYFFNDGDELTFTKTSGAGTTVAATYVSGPTKVGNTYQFVYQFGENNSGSGTFGVTSAKTYTNYRTQCCTRTDLTFGTIASPVTEYVITREDLARADAAVEIDCNFESVNTTTSIEWYSTNRVARTFITPTGAYTWTTPTSQPTELSLDVSHKKISAATTGVYTITIKQEAATISATDYCEQFATVTVTVKTVDKFVDAVNGNNSGEALRLEDVGDGIILPREETFSINNACHSTTRRLRGWIKASDLNTQYNNSVKETGYLEDATNYNSSQILAPGTKVQATGTTWYAVWGEEVVNP